MAEPDSVGSDPEMALAHVLSPKKGVSLTLGSDALIVKDRDLAKRHRTRFCGVAISKLQAEITIPYYNILWASVSDELITIDYTTNKSSNHLQCEKLQYSLTETPTAAAQAWAEKLLNHAYGQAQRQRRAKILINPHAGPGGAVRIWEHDVKPIFDAARMIQDVVKTTHQGQGVEICETLDIDAYDVVVVCSGDGLAYEVFNGFGKRTDARTALQKVAVAHIPCGSGNALSCNLNGSYHPGPSALAVVKGIRTSVDLMSLTQGSQRMLSFLSQSVGIIAECDLGTEHMRWLGAKRFDVGVAQRIFSKKVYPCDISVKVEIETKDQIKAHYKRIHSGEDSQKKESGESTAESSLAISESKPDTGDGLPPLRFGTVNDKVPEDWQTASYDKMGSFYCGNMAWMAPDANFFNAACINDGMMDVVINDGDIPALKYLDLMTSVETGKFFDNSLVSYRKVVAYRFTPRDQTDGYISIDGERIPFEPFQVEVHPGLGTVLSKSGRYEANGPPNWEQSA
ncbi:sphingoid long chain base kinase-like protein [Nemania sp. FL0031]|nr:sphingoid long chain base kinase-like protein [Nemania sp. FL0031]